MEDKRPGIDILTLIAISILAWSSVNILHEIVGHAGSAVLMGIPVYAVSTTTFYSEWSPVNTITQAVVVNAMGPTMNLITGVVALIWLKSSRVTRSSTRYFMWLFVTFSFIIVSVNFVSAPLVGGGDFNEIINRVDNPDIWKPIIIGVGIILTVVGYISPLRLWLPNLQGNRRALLIITVIPVLVAIVVQTLSLVGSPFAKLPPDQNHLLASVFAFAHFLLWAFLVYVIPIPRSGHAPKQIELPRSNTVIAMGLVMALFFIGVLGPGLGPLEEDPRLERFESYLRLFTILL